VIHIIFSLIFTIFGDLHINSCRKLKYLKGNAGPGNIGHKIFRSVSLEPFFVYTISVLLGLYFKFGCMQNFLSYTMNFFKFLNSEILKRLSHETDFENVDKKLTDLGLNKGRGWFFNFSEAPLIFS
jgi:hypothetical protein